MINNNKSDSQCSLDDEFFDEFLHSHFQKRIESLTNLLQNPVIELFDTALKEFAEYEKKEVGAFLLPSVDAWGVSIPAADFITERIQEAIEFLKTAQKRRQSLALAMLDELVEAYLKVNKISMKDQKKIGHQVRLEFKEVVKSWFADLDQYYYSIAQNVDKNNPVAQAGQAGEFYRRLDEVRNIERLAHAVQFSETVSKKDYFSGVSYLMYEINRIQLTFVVPEAIETINNQFDMLEKSFHAAKTLLKNNGPIKNFFNRWVRKMNPNSNTEQRYAEQIKTILENIRKDLDSLQKIIKSHETLEIFKDTQFERYFYEKLDSKILKKIRNLEKGFDHYENELEKLNRSICQKVK